MCISFQRNKTSNHSESGTSFHLVRTAWDPEVTDLFRYGVYAPVCRSIGFSSYLVIGPLLQSSWPGLSINNKRTEYIVFIAASRVRGAVRTFGFIVTQRLEPGLSLQCYHLSLLYVSHHSCWPNCNSLPRPCPCFAHGSLQTPFKALTA